jgi:uncharacterized membrane protein
LLDELLSLGINKELTVLIIAALPIFELRGAIPVAINIFHFPWYYALAIAIIGNMLPIPFILLFLDFFVKILKRIKVMQRFFEWLFERTKRQGGLIQKYESIGLAIFVGIPLPLTGAWTGALAATLFGLSFWRSLLAILAGVIIAGAIVTALSLLGWVGAVIAGIALCGLAIFSLWRW